MKHLDLFSGIGGFALAAQQVWKEQYENIGFCDKDWFCQQVLKKNFPCATIHADIRTLTNPHGTRPQGQDGAGQTGRSGDRGYADLVTGGFPCQPFSQAGKRRGTDDDRYLWPEMLRVIREFRPLWVIGENVGGFVTWNEGLVLEQVCTDLEAEGYEVQPFIIPACAVNAPHRRDRVWIVARYAEYDGRDGAEDAQGNFERSYANAPWPDKVRQPKRANSLRALAADAAKSIVGGLGLERQPIEKTAQFALNSWELNWQEVAAATCVPRVDDGLSKRVVRLPDGNSVSEARWRKEAIKAYGNAIVPQVATQIMKAIMDTG